MNCSSKFKIYLLLYFIVAFPFVTYSQTHKIDSSLLKVLRIDPEQAKNVSASILFDEVKFINLEVNSNSKFQNIDKLEVYKKQFIIYDASLKRLLSFYENGQHVFTIDHEIIKKILGIKELAYLNFRIIENEHKELLIVKAQNFWLYFDLKGKYIRKEEILGNDKIVLLTKDYALAEDYKENEHLHKLALFINNKLIAKYLHEEVKNGKRDFYIKPSGRNQSYSATNFLFTTSYNTDIYKVKFPNLLLLYKIILPLKNTLPKYFLTDTNYIGQKNRLAFLRNNNELIHSLSNIYIFNNKLFFKTEKLNQSSISSNSFCYSLTNKELYSLNKIAPDSITNYLPITDSGLGYSFLSNGINFGDNEYIYTSYSPSIFLTYNFNEKDKIALNTIKSILKTNDFTKSNPLIVKLKPKSN